MSSIEENSEPLLPPDSPGSSVSARLQDEYDELLRYAVVVPTLNADKMPKTLTDLRQNFPTMGTVRGQDREDGMEHDTLVKEAELIQDEQNDQMEEESETGHAVNDTDEVQSVSDIPDPPGAGNSSTPNLVRVQQKRTQVQVIRETDKVATELFTDRPDTPDSASTISALGLGKRSGSPMEEVPLAVDPDMARMERLMDQWTYELKRNVLAEFSQSKIQMLEHQRQLIIKEKERHAAEMTRIQNEVESLKELLHTYEQSIERKDQVISNLTSGLTKQREKYEMLRTFCEWKMRHNDQKREAFAMNLATQHHERRLCQKVWAGWHSVIENKWRTRVEKACQAKAQEVCMSLTNDYETRIASLNEALEAARQEVVKLHEERERYEETMKKAFMRGVCALNMEAMTMFHDGEGGKEKPAGVPSMPAMSTVEPSRSDIHPEHYTVQSDADLHTAVTVQQEPVYASEPPGAPPPRVVTSQATSRGFHSQSGTITAGTGMSAVRSKTKSKVISARVTASGKSSGYGPATLAPPMSSVIVERHQPVVKQTLGHATASRYPKQAQQQASIVHRKIAGQSGSVPIASPNIQTVKVVE